MPVKVVLLLWCAAAYPETRAPRARSARRAARRVCGGGREPWTAAEWARERASALADGVGGERAFPVFLKFHKVGSATVSRAIRCAALSHPALVADAWDRDATARVANASAAFSCGPMPYEHHTLALYARHGLDALRACTRAEQRGRFAPRGDRPRAPLAALLFSCNGRGTNMYDDAGHDSRRFLDGGLGAPPIGGFFCNGEIGPLGTAGIDARRRARTHIHGFTSVFALIYDTSPEAGAP